MPRVPATALVRPSAAPGTGALAVIDMQHVFGDADSPWATPRFAEVVEPVRRLVAAYAPHVVFTRFLAPDTPTGSWVPYYEQWPFALQPPDAPIYRLADELGELAGGPTVDATTFSKWGPALARHVGPGGTLVLAGVSTDCCVLSTALAAADDGVTVRVVAQACAGVDDASHAKALDIMNLYAPLVQVISLDEALAAAR